MKDIIIDTLVDVLKILPFLFITFLLLELLEHKLNNKTKNDLGIIRFSDMIPVPQESVYLLDIKSKSYGYRRLLSEQYSYINKPENKEKIMEKAEKIYSIVTKNNKSRMAKFYKDLSCDFKLLEEKCREYNK